MGRRATGRVYSEGGAWYVRVTLDGKRPTFGLGGDERRARERGPILAELAGKLRESGHLALAPQILQTAAEADDPSEAIQSRRSSRRGR